MKKFGLGNVGFVFGGREGEDGRGVEDCGGWEGEGGEDSSAFFGLLLARHHPSKVSSGEEFCVGVQVVFDFFFA